MDKQEVRMKKVTLLTSIFIVEELFHHLSLYN